MNDMGFFFYTLHRLLKIGAIIVFNFLHTLRIFSNANVPMFNQYPDFP